MSEGILTDVIPVNAARSAAEITVAGGKRNAFFQMNFLSYRLEMAWGSVGTSLLFGRSWDRFPVVSLGIFSVPFPDRTMCPEVDSASESEYQGFLLG